jgi:hypothetical protein
MSPSPERALLATFLREGGGPDRIAVRRSDGSGVSWRFPTYHGTLPHDLVHLVVEAGFGLRRGFWGLVDGGADPAHVNEMAARSRDGFRGFGDDRSELLMAEGLAATHWFDPALDDAALCDAIAEGCALFHVAPPASTTPARAGAVRVALAAVRARWRRLGPGEALCLTFHADDPEATLADIG